MVCVMPSSCARLRLGVHALAYETLNYHIPKLPKHI